MRDLVSYIVSIYNKEVNKLINYLRMEKNVISCMGGTGLRNKGVAVEPFSSDRGDFFSCMGGL